MDKRRWPTSRTRRLSVNGRKFEYLTHGGGIAIRRVHDDGTTGQTFASVAFARLWEIAARYGYPNAADDFNGKRVTLEVARYYITHLQSRAVA